MKTSIAFETFFKENYSRFYFLAFRWVEDEEISRDIVSDGFEYVWRNYRKDDVANWQAYMCTVVKNKCIDHIRRQEVKAKYIEFYRQMISEDVDDDDDAEELQTIYRIIDTLSPQTKLILQECYLNGKKYREVAEELNISESTVKKHIIKALKTLRETMVKTTTRKK